MKQKPRFWFLGLVALAAQSAGTAAASPPTDADPASRENPSFEAQGNLGAVVEGIADTLREWWNAGMLNDGAFDLGYTLQADGDQIAHNMDVSLETRIFGIRASSGSSNCDQLNICGSDALILPIEIRVRTDVETRDVSVPYLRIALTRMVFHSIGLTGQAFSIIRRDFGPGQTELFGLEVLSLDANEALEIAGTGGKLELIVKGSVTFGFGGLSSRDANIRAGIEQAGGPSDSSGWAFDYSAGGSVGVRIARRVVVELFGNIFSANGGVSPAGASQADSDESVPDVGSLAFRDFAYGGAVRYMATDWLHVKGGLRSDSYRTKFLSSEGTGVGNARRVTSANVTVELRW